MGSLHIYIKGIVYAYGHFSAGQIAVFAREDSSALLSLRIAPEHNGTVRCYFQSGVGFVIIPPRLLGEVVR
jgi:hypothetical protein